MPNKDELTFAFDASPSKRRYDENGYLHVADCPITKEQVVRYLGIEIPRSKELGLDPKKEYYGYRPADEIIKAAETFSGVPLLLDHEAESANKPTDRRVGSVGTSPRWDAPYLRQPLSITDAKGIKAVETGEMQQLSSSYRYDPDFTAGVFEGQHYDFIMRNIRANHVALVRKGRAGADVIVEDSDKLEDNMPDINDKLDAKDNEPPQNPDGSEVVAKDNVDEIIAKIAGMDAESLAKLRAALGTDTPEAPKEEEKTAVDEIAEAMKGYGLDSANEEMRKAFEMGRDSLTPKEETVAAMDSATFIKELGLRNKYAKALEPFVGAFDSDTMTLQQVLTHGCKALGINVAKGHEMPAIDGYLKNRVKVQDKTVGLANDSVPVESAGAKMIDQLFGGK